MINYPNTLPTDAVLIIVDKLRGKTSNWSDVMLAGWNLLGYALSQIPSNSPDRILEAYTQLTNISINTEEDAATFLETNVLANQGSIEGKDPAKMSGVVLLVIINIITKFIINVL
jgi:hypothetical protein